MESELHAESLAKYFQDVQWAVRPVSIATTDSPIGSPLPVETGPFNDEEIVAAASRLRRNKATGTDHVPAEFWKAICRRTSPACRWATTLCNAIREHVMVPSSWHDASVTAIYKKGDPGLCKNYRPITVVSAGYKLFAMALLRRLQKAGAEERIRPTQFAFRTKRGSADAIFVARRLLDLTLADRNGTLVMLSLTGKKLSILSVPMVCFTLSKDLVYRLCFAALSGQFTATGLSQSARLVIHRLHILNALAFRKDARFHHSFFNLDDGVIYRCHSGVPIRLRP